MTGLGRRLYGRLAGTQAARADVVKIHRAHPPDVAGRVIAARLVDAECRVVAILGGTCYGDLDYYRAYHQAMVEAAGQGRGER